MELGANFKGASGSDGIMAVLLLNLGIRVSCRPAKARKCYFTALLDGSRFLFPLWQEGCWARGRVQPVWSRMEPWIPARSLAGLWSGLECCVTVTAGLELVPGAAPLGKAIIPSVRNPREVQQCPTLSMMLFGQFTGFQVWGFFGSIPVPALLFLCLQTRHTKSGSD